MKKFEDINEFEQLLKKQLDGHTSSPPSDVWTHVSASTTQGASGLAQTVSFFKSATNLLKVGLFAGGIAAIGIVVYNENKTQDQVPNSPEVLVVDSLIAENTEGDEETEVLVIEKSKNADAEAATPTNSSVERQKSLENNDQTTGIKDKIEDSPSDVLDKSIGSEKSKTSDEVSNILERKELTISVSKNTPCKGETVILRSSFAGDWYINGEKLVSNSSELTYLCNEVGQMLVSLQTGPTSAEESIQVLDNSFTITKTQKSKDNYSFQTQPSGVLVDWTLNGALVKNNSSSLTVTLDKVGQYNLVGIPTGLSCAENVSVSLTKKSTGYLKTYNTFTPNGDGHNDEYPIEIRDYDNFTVQIFDRNSRMIFSSQDPDNKWNGREFNVGEECLPGEYIARIKYQLKGENSKTENVRLTLIRP